MIGRVGGQYKGVIDVYKLHLSRGPNCGIFENLLGLTHAFLHV